MGNEELRKCWVEIVRGFLRRMGYVRGDLQEFLKSVYTAGGFFSFINPYPPNALDALLAAIDVERAIQSGCRSVEEIVDFLHCVEEGWFFEEKLWKARLKLSLRERMGKNLGRRGNAVGA